MAPAPRLVAPLAALALLANLAAAHYNLRDPAPYNPIDCNRPNCNTPCPPIWLTGPARATNSPENPSRSWARGDEVEIEWHRNNHEGGFYRRSLVPVKHMNSHYWHNKMAFEWGCWAQGRWDCGFDATCGTDKNGFAYRNRMTVPHVFPDGDYVFAQAWYGGLHWRRQRGFFTDYRTCAFVRIEGGEFWGKYEPKFVAGTSHYSRKHVTPGMCVSASHFLGECKGLGCRTRRPFRGFPFTFSKGRKPPTLYLRDFNRSVVPNRATRQDLQFGTMQEELAAIIEQTKERNIDNKLVQEEREAPRRQQGRGKWGPGAAARPNEAARPYREPPVV